MHFITSLAPILFLAGNAFAQYGGGYSSGSGSSGSGSGSGASMQSSGSSSMSMSSSMAAAPTSASTATPSGQVMVHVVKVSNKKEDLTFEPNNLRASPGDMVQFHFYPKNHSVVQSTFDQPCQPIKNNNPSSNGFFSGFMPVKAGAAMMPSYTIMINDTKPIWYYCSQGDHCQDGMVGVINPPAANQSRTIEAYGALAKKATENLSPGQSASSSSSSNSDSTDSSASSSSTGSSYSSSSGSGSSGALSSSAASPAASGDSSSSTVTMPLAGSNSSSITTGAATPSGSAGGQSPAAFAPGSGANIAASRLDIFSSLGLAGVVGFIVSGLL
ncbi:MAG: hypothetical protein Q9181_002203 [Wetmoreana brouardii]